MQLSGWKHPQFPKTQVLWLWAGWDNWLPGELRADSHFNVQNAQDKGPREPLSPFSLPCKIKVQI